MFTALSLAKGHERRSSVRQRTNTDTCCSSAQPLIRPGWVDTGHAMYSDDDITFQRSIFARNDRRAMATPANKTVLHVVDVDVGRYASRPTPTSLKTITTKHLSVAGRTRTVSTRPGPWNNLQTVAAHSHRYRRFGRMSLIKIILWTGKRSEPPTPGKKPPQL